MKNKYIYISLTIILLLLLLIGALKSYTRDDFIMEGTKYESPVYYLDGKSKTKIFIISGIHGNEIAGIETAEKVLEDKPTWASFVIIPRANTEAIKLNVRNPYYMSDLNRAFPGKADGTDTEKIAHEIYKLIEREKPHMVIDLHEWERSHDEDSNSFSNGLILNSFDSGLWESVEKVYNDYIERDNPTKIMLSISPSKGSLNKEVTQGLGIPVLTVESNMNDDLDRRIDFHLETIENTIKYFEMDD